MKLEIKKQTKPQRNKEASIYGTSVSLNSILECLTLCMETQLLMLSSQTAHFIKYSFSIHSSQKHPKK